MQSLGVSVTGASCASISGATDTLNTEWQLSIGTRALGQPLLSTHRRTLTLGVPKLLPPRGYKHSFTAT